MTTRYRLRTLVLVGLTALGATLGSSEFAAAQVDPLSALVGLSGKVNIGEREGFPVTTFHVDVLDPTIGVAAFAVSTDFIAVSASTATSFPDWAAHGLHAAEWDAGYMFSIAGATPVNTNSLGTASELFGDDPYVNLYFLNTGSNVIFDDGVSANDQDQASWDVAPAYFQVAASRRSEFIALGIDGQVLELSHAVPEPGTLFLAAAAFACLGLARRRR